MSKKTIGLEVDEAADAAAESAFGAVAGTALCDAMASYCRQ